MSEFQRPYLPAAGKHWRLPFYDVLARLVGGDRGRSLLARQVSCKPGSRILEVGCGTGELLLLLKRAHPAGLFTGLDPDPKALERARGKARRAGLAISFDQGFAEELPYAEASFDGVVSCFMFHHLEVGAKARMLTEVRRVLRPGAPFHLVDFAGPSTDGRSFVARRVHSHSRLKDNDEDRVLEMMREAGLVDPMVASRTVGWLTEMVCYRALCSARRVRSHP
jgi:ubiquinone/menaquinone biosynthesis C-methylase UbiE